MAGHASGATESSSSSSSSSSAAQHQQQQPRTEYSRFNVDAHVAEEEEEKKTKTKKTIRSKASYVDGGGTGGAACWLERHCFKGYCWAAVAAVYFFVIFPGCILVIIAGYHKGVALTLCLGVLLLIGCSCLLPGSYVCIHRWKKRRRQTRLAARVLHCAAKEKAAFVNRVNEDA